MEMLKKIGVLLLLGFLVGAGISTLVAPRMLEWYNTGSDAGALCNCASIARATSSQLIRSQFIGGIIGGVFFVIAGVVISRIRAAKTPAKPAGTA